MNSCAGSGAVEVPVEAIQFGAAVIDDDAVYGNIGTVIDQCAIDGGVNKRSGTFAGDGNGCEAADIGGEEFSGDRVVDVDRRRANIDLHGFHRVVGIVEKIGRVCGGVEEIGGQEIELQDHTAHSSEKRCCPARQHRLIHTRN